MQEFNEPYRLKKFISLMIFLKLINAYYENYFNIKKFIHLKFNIFNSGIYIILLLWYYD